MTPENNNRIVLCACTVALVFGGGELRGADGSETEPQLRELRQQNQVRQEQLRQQGSLIDRSQVGQVKADFTLGISNLPKP